MADDLVQAGKLFPVILMSLLISTLRALIAGRRSLRVALATWPIALGLSFAGGWTATEFGFDPGWVLVVTGACAIAGENLVVGLVELSSRFREDPEGSIRRWSAWWRGGSHS